MSDVTQSKHWRWMPGMVREWSDSTGRNSGRQRLTDKTYSWELREGYTYRPDFEDPATLGCLLHLVREAWEQDLNAQRHGIGWAVWGYERIALGPTEADALKAALLAAP